MFSLISKLPGLARMGIVAASAALGDAPNAAPKASDLKDRKSQIDEMIEETRDAHDGAHQSSERRAVARQRLDVLEGQAYVATFQLHSLLTRAAGARLRAGEARAHQDALKQHRAAQQRRMSRQAALDDLVSKLGSVADGAQVRQESSSDAASAWAAAVAAGRTEEAQRLAAEIEQAARDAQRLEDEKRIANRARTAQVQALQQRVEAAQAELQAAVDGEAGALDEVLRTGLALAAIEADLASSAALEAEVLVRSLALAARADARKAVLKGGHHHTDCAFRVGTSAKLASEMAEFGAQARVWDANSIGLASSRFAAASQALPSLDDVLALPADNPRKRSRGQVVDPQAAGVSG